MTGPLTAAGAVSEPSEYATISMDRAITGMWTQRVPLRDANVPYLYGKFYSASRFDSLIDGINREINARLGNARRAGSSLWNSNTFPAINSFYSWKYIQNGSSLIRILVDGADGVIYDATAGTKTTIFTKAAGAGKTRFLGVNTTLYFADGVEQKKYLQPAGWVKQTSFTTSQYEVGTTVIDSNGNLEYLNATKVGNITNVVLAAGVVTLTFNNTNFNLATGNSFTPAGLGAAAFLNGKRLVALSVVSSGSNFLVAAKCVGFVNYASAADTGTATTTDVGTITTTGSTVPTWSGALGGTTSDGLSTWTNYGTPIYDWGPPAPPRQAPTLSGVPLAPALTFWRPNSAFGQSFIVDNKGGIQENLGNVGTFTGSMIPVFSEVGAPTFPTGSSETQDGSSTWIFCGNISDTWTAALTLPTPGASGGYCLVDSNGNLQQVVTGGGATGGTSPTWNQTVGGTTVDGAVTWINRGAVSVQAFSGDLYGYAFHCIDGSLSTLSPLTPSTNGVIGGVTVGAQGSASPQVDSIWIFRTADGQPTPLFLSSIPNPGAAAWSYLDQNPDSALIAQIPGPQASSNNPPPVGITAPVFHCGRIWAIYQNGVVNSGGPDVLAGNGYTAFSPGAFTPLTEQPIRLYSGVTKLGPTLFIMGTTNVWAIYGNGTASNPFTQAAIYMADVGILGYDAFALVGSTFYMLTGKNKFVSLDPGAGYVEQGFPIGDQFSKVTTGGISSSLYNAASTYVAWAEISSGDTAVYVADGSVGWFRLSPVASPETGFLWSPRAAIVGGTSAVQAVETAAGVTQLLIGPASSGPILFRDSTVNADWHSGAYQSFPAWSVKGNIVLCQSGEIAEIAHIGLKSAAVGARPVVALLLGEISSSTATPFEALSITSSDPPDIPKSLTMFSDRYTALQNGVCPKCDNFQLKIDYGTQNFPDEEFMFSVYGAKHAERKQQ